MKTLKLQAGRSYPLGATLDGDGVNFAVYSEHATAIELCVFDPASGQCTGRGLLPATTDDVRHGRLAGARAGLVYGLRAHGPYAPHDGHRFNANKLLLDPYAREIVGHFGWRDEHFGFQRGHPDGHRTFDHRDNAPWALKARVAAPLPQDAGHCAPPRIPIDRTVLYEMHVKGFTRRHPAIPEALRGTYAGLAHPAAIDHLVRLGVTTVSLLPVHYSLTEERLTTIGLSNFWGYNTLGYFACDPRLSATPDDPTATRAEFRAMVDALHRAGLEVVLDVVYNHSAEGSEAGPTLSLRGLDNAAYYRLQPDDRARTDNLTGCGNTLDFSQRAVVRLVLDSLRYWVAEMGVDGFRFDLASVCGRLGHGFERHAPFFVALEQDPVLAGAKLIAEPWDAGPGGYQLGQFPGRFLEWNDVFRDSTRLFWLSRGVASGEFARRLTASSDRFHHGTRRPTASVNFVTAHDGFTLTDLVTYNHRHNHANGELNRDGHQANFSHNCGVEGPSGDASVTALRGQLKRAMLATLLCAQGTPMLLAGDEIGRTQHGNNNAYCQDNDVGWLDWEHADEELQRFVTAAIALRRRHPALRQAAWLNDGPHRDGRHEVVWRAPGGAEMTVADWNDPSRGCFAAWLTPRDHAAVLLIVNGQATSVRFRLPPGRWTVDLDSSLRGPHVGSTVADWALVPDRTLLVLCMPEPA
ncbi:MAG TPA: glycogen debranching protein GlgX [Burkholderiaceae bacterium]|nr:glycogen debranching protein GlgX [Burkholderiaceae bacterium]